MAKKKKAGLSAERQRQEKEIRLLTVEPEEVGMSSTYLDYIDEVMQRSIEEKMMKGMVTLVARHGRIVQFKAYGQMEEGVPMKKDCIFRLASMSKTIGAAALMQLYDRGIVMPSDPVSAYIPAFANPMVAEPGENGDIVLVPAKREPTVHDLLTMTSGVSAVRAMDSGHPGHEYCAALYKEKGIIDTMHGLDMTIAEVVDQVAGLPLGSHPGEHWEYSNLSSIITGRIVEIASGMSLDSYLKKYIFEPLGMQDTAFFPEESKWTRIPAVHACGSMEKLTGLDVPGTDDTTLPFSQAKKYFNISAGLTGTAYDYFKFAQMLLNRGIYRGKRLLSPNAVQLMTTNHMGDRQDSIYGHTWGYMMDVMTAYNTTFNYMGLGSYSWHGYWGSCYNVWPEKDVIAIFLSQVSPVGMSWKTQERFLNVTANAVMDDLM